MSKNSKLALAIARSTMAIDHMTGLMLYPRTYLFLTGQTDSFWGNDEQTETGAVAFLASNTEIVSLESVLGGTADAPKGAVGILNVNGVMMKDSFCGNMGTMEMAEAVKQIDGMKEVSAIMPVFDSPGGMVQGTETFADSLLNANKKTVGVVQNGSCCSAAYWAASACDEVYATHATCWTGSIGVYSKMSDYAQYFKDKGIVEKEFYAPQSSEKNEETRSWLAGDEDAKLFCDRLGLVAQEFIDAVQDNRKGKLNMKAGDPFKGRVYGAKLATEIGLIDGIRPYDAVLNSLLNERQTIKVL